MNELRRNEVSSRRKCGSRRDNNKKVKKVKLSRYTPWTQMGGEDV
jgi:hypothetical protein